MGSAAVGGGRDAMMGVSVCLLTMAITPFAPDSPEEILAAVKNHRAAVRSYDLTAITAGVSEHKRTGKTGRLCKELRVLKVGSSHFVSLKSTEQPSGKVLKLQRMCRGCIPDQYFHLRDDLVQANSMMKDRSGADNFIRQQMFDLNRLGLVFGHVEALGTSGPIDFDEPDLGPPYFLAIQPAKPLVVICQDYRSRAAQLRTTVDLSKGPSVVTLEAIDRGEPGSICKVESKYQGAVDGIYYPITVTLIVDNKTVRMDETITFTARAFNDSVSAADISPTSLGLRHNCLIQNLTKNDPPITRFYDGSSTVKYPPDPAEYLGPSTPPEPPPSRLGYYVAAALCMLAAAFLLFYRRFFPGR